MLYDSKRNRLGFNLIFLLVVWSFVLPACVYAGDDLFGEVLGRYLGKGANDNPIPVKVGIRIQQITDVNQKEENFGVVASIALRWHDPIVAEKLLKEGRQLQAYGGAAFEKDIANHQLAVPRFFVPNQQGARQSDNVSWIITREGENLYFERFSATLQAPDFDFTQYPMDEQQFYVHIELLLPENIFYFVPAEGYSKLGDSLGEEEWMVRGSNVSVSTNSEITGLPNSRFSFEFTAERHINYYLIRIFVPILIILTVSWITFFLKDYRKRIDIAGGNLLLFIAFNFSISGNLPKLGYLTFLDSTLFIAFLMTSLVILLNVIFRRMETSGYDTLANKIDSWLLWLYPAGFIVAVIWLYSHFFQ